jgi:hypothetical protein
VSLEDIEEHAKYLDTRCGCIRLAAIKDNSAASIQAFVKANVKAGRDPHKRDCRRHDRGIAGRP